MKFHFKTAIINCFLIFLLGTFSEAANADNAVSSQRRLLALADSLFRFENYEAAITEYKRFLFFHPQHDSLARVYYHMGLACQQNADHESAVQHFFKSMNTCDSEQRLNETRLSIAVSNIALGDYNLALFETQKVLINNVSDDMNEKASLLACMIMTRKDNWEQARIYFEKYIDYSDNKPDIKVLDSLFQRGEALPLKSPKRAKLLSAFLPGSGQYYAGHHFDAMNAFLLNSITFSFNIYLITIASYVDATLFFLYVTLRFYRGNLYNAANQAKMVNETELQHIENQCTIELYELLKK